MSREVRIFQPAKTAMQSGRARAHSWFVAFKPTYPTSKDALIGWVSSRDMHEELHLHFQTLEDAVAYAEGQNWLYTVDKPKTQSFQPKSYADNFTLGRLR